MLGHFRLRAMGLFVTFFVAPTAWAYHLPEHADLTRHAVAEINDCFPGLVPAQDVEELVSANLAEDWNVFRKWFRYSHYYNPVHPIHMPRRSSMARVRNLEGRSLDDLGAILHHLQDMTVPAHVVPIQHAARDEFENLGLREWDEVNTPELDQDCGAILAHGHLPFDQLLQQTALKTWERIEADPWNRTWLPSSGVAMGSYGTSHFADREFKQLQRRLALDATKAALYRRYVLLDP